jgi:hypothetical protein
VLQDEPLGVAVIVGELMQEVIRAASHRAD